MLMNDLWERCEREHYRQEESSWNRQARALYKRYIGPAIGRSKVAAVDYAAVSALHVSFRKRATQGNRVLAVLSKLLALAERWGLRPTGSNPCQHVKRYKEAHRRRYATAAEIAAIGESMQRRAETHPEAVAFLQLMIFTGARPTELLRAPLSILERLERHGQACGVLRIAQGKTGARDVFLPPQAMATLDLLPPKRNLLVGLAGVPRRMWASIQQEVGCPDLWVRDLRRTFASVALSSGTPLSVVGELLGHKSAQTTKIYGRLIEDRAHEASAATAGLLAGMLRS